MGMVYAAKRGARISDTDAQILGARFEELLDENSLVTPEIILDDARRKSSPIHGYFEWDDLVAAERYRRSQAGYYLRSIEVIVDREDEPRVRAFEVVRPKEDAEPGYAPYKVIVGSRALLHQVIARYEHDLAALRTQMEAWEELAPVARIIGAALERLEEVKSPVAA